MECPVCLEEIKESELFRVQCCQKPFHAQCYLKAMSVNQSCPLCRAPHTVVHVQQPILIPVQTHARIPQKISCILVACIIITYIGYSLSNLK